MSWTLRRDKAPTDRFAIVQLERIEVSRFGEPPLEDDEDLNWHVYTTVYQTPPESSRHNKFAIVQGLLQARGEDGWGQGLVATTVVFSGSGTASKRAAQAFARKATASVYDMCYDAVRRAIASQAESMDFKLGIPAAAPDTCDVEISVETIPIAGNEQP